MARSGDIQNDINHLQARWDNENHAAQNVDTKKRSLVGLADYRFSDKFGVFTGAVGNTVVLGGSVRLGK